MASSQCFVPGLDHLPIQVRPEQGGILSGDVVAKRDQVHVRARLFQSTVRNLNQDIDHPVHERFGEDGAEQKVLEPRAVAANILALVHGAVAEV